MKELALTLAFLLESAAAISYAYAGLTSTSVFNKIVFGIFFPLILISFWGIWMAPKSKRRLKQPYYASAKTIIFGGAIVALLASTPVLVPVLFFVLWVLDEILLYKTKESRPHEITE